MLVLGRAKRLYHPPHGPPAAGSIDVYDLACAARLAFLQLDRALNGDRHDPEEMELAQFALRDVMNKAERLNAKHGTGPA